MALTDEQWKEIYEQADDEQKARLRQDKEYWRYRDECPTRVSTARMPNMGGVTFNHTFWRPRTHWAYNQVIRPKFLGVVYHLYYIRDWRDTLILNYVMEHYSKQWRIKTCSRKLIQTAMQEVDDITTYCIRSGESYPWNYYGEVTNARLINRYLANKYQYQYTIVTRGRKEKQVITVRQKNGRPPVFSESDLDEIYALRKQAWGYKRIHKVLNQLGIVCSESIVAKRLQDTIDPQLWKDGIRLVDSNGNVKNAPDEDE